MRARAGWSLLVALPLVGLWILLAAPSLDVEWEHHPAHFWLVLGVALLNAALAFPLGDAARRRGDARVYLISLAFLAGAGFFALHALATPGVVLEASNTGFTIATPVGLMIAGGFAAASAAELTPSRSTAVLRICSQLRYALVGVLALWAGLSLGSVPPLDDPLAEEVATGWLIGFAAVGVVLYSISAARYYQVYRERPTFLLLAVITAFALLAEAMIAIAFARNWHATWWEWHMLMLISFALIAYAARRQWGEERFHDLYLRGTKRRKGDISVLFADLEGYTSFAEGTDPTEVASMLNVYFQVAVPTVVKELGGELDKFVGDAIMVTFNTKGDQPDHPALAARAGLALQREAGRIAAENPGWPRFRVGVNTGEAMVGELGTEGVVSYTVIGDTVNLAARLEGQARPGEVVIGEATRAALGGAAHVDDLGELAVKGKDRPVRAYVLKALDA